MSALLIPVHSLLRNVGFVIVIVALSVTGSAGRAAAQNPASSPSTSTRLMIRAVARNAKIIGSDVGGARIVVQEVATGKIRVASDADRGNFGMTTGTAVVP